VTEPHKLLFKNSKFEGEGEGEREEIVKGKIEGAKQGAYLRLVATGKEDNLQQETPQKFHERIQREAEEEKKGGGRRHSRLRPDLKPKSSSFL